MLDIKLNSVTKISNELELNSIESSIKQYLHIPVGIVEIDYTVTGPELKISKIIAYIPFLFKNNQYVLLPDNMTGSFLIELEDISIPIQNTSVYVELVLKPTTTLNQVEYLEKVSIVTEIPLNPSGTYFKIGIIENGKFILDYNSFQETDYYERFYNGVKIDVFSELPTFVFNGEEIDSGITLDVYGTSVIEFKRKLRNKLIYDDNDFSIGMLKLTLLQNIDTIDITILGDNNNYKPFFIDKDSDNNFSCYFKFDKDCDFKDYKMIININTVFGVCNIVNYSFFITVDNIIHNDKNYFDDYFDDNSNLEFDISSLQVYMNILLTFHGINRDLNGLFVQDINSIKSLSMNMDKNYRDGFKPSLYSNTELDSFICVTPSRLRGFNFDNYVSDGKLHNGFPVIAFVTKLIKDNDLDFINKYIADFDIGKIEIITLSDLDTHLPDIERNPSKTRPISSNAVIKNNYTSKLFYNIYPIENGPGPDGRKISLFPKRRNEISLYIQKLYISFGELAEVDDAVLSNVSEIENKNVSIIKFHSR